jgi:uncharacterized protein YcfJ
MFKQILGVAALLITLPLAAQAGDYTRTEYVTVSQPRQQCWNEQVAVSGHNNDGAIVGGIAGGIIGNQVGRGNGRVAATAVGAVTGAIVGERLSGNGGVQYRTVQRCNTVYEQVQVPRTVTYVAPAPVYYQPQQVVYINGYPHRHGRNCGHVWRDNIWVDVEYRGHHHHHHHDD